MTTTPTSPTRRFGLRWFSRARALLAVSALAALAVPTRSLAQATFNTLATTSTNSSFNFPGSGAIGDYNGDGKLDVLVTDGSSDFRLMLGNGNGTFNLSNVNAPGTNLGAVRAADLNGDGKLDAVCVSNGGNFAVTVLLNTGNDVNGAPQFTVTDFFTGLNQVRSTSVGDLNGDGKPDLIVGTGLGSVVVFLNNGDGSFTKGQTTNLLPGVGGPSVGNSAIVDLNGDGKMDYVVSSAQNSATNVFLGNGDGTLQTAVVIPTNGALVTVADVNHDGKPDLLEIDGSSLLVFLNSGDGTFSAAPISYPAGIVSAASLTTADFNGDGNVDVVVSDFNNGSGRQVSVLLGNGQGAFSASAFYSVNQGPLDVAVGDFNNDGKLDIATVGRQDRTYGVLLNTTVFISAPSVASATRTPSFGQPFSYQISATNSPGTYGATGLPTGLSVDQATGLISGTPTQSGNFAVDLSATNNGGTGHGTLSLTIAPLATQTLTILGGSGSVGSIAPNVEYFNPATGNWQPTYLTGGHPFGLVPGTNSWINYEPSNLSDPGAGPTPNQTLWYLYRVRFTVPSDAINPQMSFSVKADNFAQVAINGVTAGGSTQFINNTNMPNVVVGSASGLNADAVFSQNVHPGENTITLNIGDYGGLNGFNFRIDLSMLASQPIEIVTPPAVPAPVVASASATGTYGTAFSYQISATNSPTGYGAANLPSGLTVNSSGLISGAPTQAGTFTIGLSATNNGGTGTGTLTLTVGKKSATITLADLSYVYDGKAKSATATTEPAGLAVTFNSGNSNTNAGTYPIIASISDANYTGSSSADLVITKAPSTTTTTTLGADPFIYDGTTHAGGSGTVAGASVVTGAATLTYSGDQVNAGSYTVIAHYAGDANHTASDGSPVTITINKAPSTTTTVGAGPFTYDGTTHTGGSGTVAGAGVVTGAATLTYADDQINAGSYTVTAHYAGDANHTPSDGSAAVVTINKATPTIAVTCYSVTYDGAAHSATATITGVNGESGAAVGALTLNSTHTDAGAYSDSWSFAGAANYCSLPSTTFTDKIAKADAIVTVNGYTGIYDGATHGATGSATGVGGANLTASLSLGATFKNAPGGTANWSFAGGPNYNDASGTAAIVINKATATVVVTPYNAEYDGQPHSATAASITGVAGETGAAVGVVTLNTAHTTVGIYASDSWSFAGANYNNIATTITDAIKDTTAPIITAPANIIAEATSAAGATVTYSASAFDLVGATLTASKASGSVFPLGTTTVTLNAVDAAGNHAVQKTFTVTVRDTTGPVITAANVVAEATSDKGAKVSFSVAALDAVSGPRSVNTNYDSGDRFPLGVTTVTATSRDAAGNLTTRTFTVTVRDTTAPTLKLPANITACATSAAGAVVRYNVDADDAVSDGSRDITFTYSKTSGSTFPLGVTTVVVTAKDEAGNVTTGSFTVTVKDTVRPVFTKLSVNPTIISKNDHSMVNVTVTATTKDNVDPSVNVRIVSVTSDEAITGTGTGDVGPDWVITGPLTLQLRAERDPHGNGRIYTITVAATDDAGNTIIRTLHVLVPLSGNTRFEDCDSQHRSESRRCDDEDRDNDSRNPCDHEDDDNQDNDHHCRGW